jgi:hypothetical protein
MYLFLIIQKICFHLNIDQKIDPAFDATLGHN